MDDASDHESLLRDNAARFAVQAAAQGLLGRRENDGELWLRTLAEGGWTGLRVAEAAGGAGLSTHDLAVIAEEFGRKLLPTSAPSIAALGVLADASSENARALLEQALAGGALVLPALQSEGRVPSPGGGARLIANGDGFRLDGVKVGVPDGGNATGFIVDAGHESATALVYVPREASGLDVETAAVVDGTQVARLVFRAVRVPHENVVATGPDAHAVLDRLRFPLQLGLAAETLGAADEIFTRTLDYLRTRRAFGRSLGAFQALQHRAVDTFADIELARALVMETARVADGGGAGMLELIAAARAKAGDVGLRVAKWAVQMHGAIGFTDEADVGLFLKRIMVLTRLYRTPEQHRRRFADWSWSAQAVNLNEMFRSESAGVRGFRQEVRAFLDAELPARLCDLPTRPKAEDAHWWHRKLYDKGWIAPAWPKAHGGMEASVEQRLVLFEEFAVKGAPELSSQGIYNIGPILIRFGTPEQQSRLLPDTLSGDLRWCQGYSEPNAGSDLASLRTSARREGDKLIVNGQKIWTTGAHVAQWMFALVRTDPDAEDRRNGISMILIDMKSKGLRVRPIRTIAGDDEFAEVFFDDVEVPVTNVIAGLNEGWKLATTVLESERLMGSSPQKVIDFLDRVRRVAKVTGAHDDPVFRDRLACAEIDVLALSAAFTRLLDSLRTVQTAGARSSILKIVNAELLQTLADLMLYAAGSAGACLDPIEAEGRSVAVGLSFLQARRASIFGGTAEIQRNIIARRVLDLGNETRRKG